MGCKGVKEVILVYGETMRLNNPSRIESRGGLLSLFFIMGIIQEGKANVIALPFGVQFLVTLEY